MKRKALALLATSSFVLCTGMMMLWVRSCFVNDALPGIITHPQLALQSGDGRLFIFRITPFQGVWIPGYVVVEGTSYSRGHPPMRFWSPPPPRAFSPGVIVVGVPDAQLINGFGFGAETSSIRAFDSRGRGSGVVVNAWAIPFWAPSAALLLIGVAAARRWRKHRAASRYRRCYRCGYDLRATPDRCPECGAVAVENSH